MVEIQEPKGKYEIDVQSCSKTKRKKRTVTLEVRFKEIEIKNSDRTSKLDIKTTKLHLIEAKEINYTGNDKICWRLLTTIPVTDLNFALNCIEIEASELESAAAIRKLCLMIMEFVIKLFLMRIAYEQPELTLEASTCFSKTEQECLEYQIEKLEGKTQKQKNPYLKEQLNRYVWFIARMVGWKGYITQRKPRIITLWIGLQKFNILMQGWELHRNMSTR